MKTNTEPCTAHIVGTRQCRCYGCINIDSTCARCEKIDGTVERHYDARGIYITRACAKCWREIRKGYRPEVLADPSYETDEPIDE